MRGSGLLESKANKTRKCLTGRKKSEILSSHRGGLCLQFFPHLNRRAFLSAAALHSPQLLSFLFALIIAQTYGPASVPRSTVRAASLRILLTRAARIALRLPFLPVAGTLSVMRRISGRMLFLLYTALHATPQRRWSASPASLPFLLPLLRAAPRANAPNIFSSR